VGGGEPDNCFTRGLALLSLGYRVMVFIDGDKPLTPTTVASFTAAGGAYTMWDHSRALEDEIFMSLGDGAIHSLIQRAVDLAEHETVNSHISTYSQGRSTVESVFEEGITTGYSQATRQLLGLASKHRRNGWFKSVTKFEGVARDIVGPHFAHSHQGFQAKVNYLFGWAHAS
jgi:putative ATP-dependent endonuclease of OLD family